MKALTRRLGSTERDEHRCVVHEYLRDLRGVGSVVVHAEEKGSVMAGYGGERCTCGHTVYFHAMSLAKARCMAMTRDGETVKGKPKFVDCTCKDFSAVVIPTGTVEG